jgi:glycosyltransferase involved in cell wall biosynthesis
VRICFTSTSYLPAIGGAQLHTHRVVRELMGRHGVVVVTQWDQNRTDWLLGTTLCAPRVAKSYVFEGVPVHQITLTLADRLAVAPSVLAYYALKRQAIDHISDVLARKIEPFAIGCDLIHNSRIGREGLSYASLKVARRLGVPFVLVPYHHPRWVGWNYRAYLDLYRMADGVIALTKGEKETLIRLGVQQDRISITGMGPILSDRSDGDRFREAHGLASNPVVLFVGQQYRYKGLEALLGAANGIWARYPTARLVFIGPPTQFSRRLFRGIGDSRITNLGQVDLQTKTDALAACDLLCVPSSQESFGGVYTEAWMLTKPVIGGDAPAVREVIEDGVDGFTVGQHALEIAEKVSYLLDNPTLGRRMGQAGRHKVLGLYTWDKLAARTEAAYLSALRGTTPTE